MYFNTVITNPSDKEIRIGFLGKGVGVIAPGASIKVPYEVLTACRNPMQKRTFIDAISTGTIKVEYQTDIPMFIADEKAAEVVNAVKADEAKKEAAKVPPVKTLDTPQEDVLTDASKDKLKKADEGLGIVDGDAESVLPPITTIGADKDENGDDIPIAQPKTVVLEDVLEGTQDIEGNIIPEDTPNMEPTAPTVADAPVVKKPVAKKPVAKKPAAKKPAAKKKVAGKKKVVKMA